MRCQRCGTCCLQTEMLLSQQDIQRLTKRGYPTEKFVRFDKEGYATLRNRQGHCVFLNPKTRRCTVYADRPEGCRVYPVVFDEEKGVVADTLCPACTTVTDMDKRIRGRKVIALLGQIDTEAEKRRIWVLKLFLWFWSLFTSSTENWGFDLFLCFFVQHHACPYQLMALVTDESDFSYVPVGLSDGCRRFQYSFFQVRFWWFLWVWSLKIYIFWVFLLKTTRI